MLYVSDHVDKKRSKPNISIFVLDFQPTELRIWRLKQFPGVDGKQLIPSHQAINKGTSIKG
jgi:hypothetical protein